MDRVLSQPCYKGTILQRNYRKITIIWSFSYNLFVKFHGEKMESTTWTCYIQIHGIMRYVIKGLYTFWEKKIIHTVNLIGQTGYSVKYISKSINWVYEECSCSVIECLTQDQGVAISSLTRALR